MTKNAAQLLLNGRQGNAEHRCADQDWSIGSVGWKDRYSMSASVKDRQQEGGSRNQQHEIAEQMASHYVRILCGGDGQAVGTHVNTSDRWFQARSGGDVTPSIVALSLVAGAEKESDD